MHEGVYWDTESKRYKISMSLDLDEAQDIADAIDSTWLKYCIEELKRREADE